MNELWISLSSDGGVTTRTALDVLWAAGIRQVELAIGVKPSVDTTAVLQHYRQRGMQYRAHHAIVWQEHRSFNRAEQFDRSYFDPLTDWMAAMNITAYSVHPGSVSLHRSDTVNQWLDQLEQLAQLCCEHVPVCQRQRGIRFGVETMYPSLFAQTRCELPRSRTEIEQFLTVLPQVEIVVDMAHLNLWHDCSTAEKLHLFQIAQNRILEIHISDNDGLRDTHTAINEKTWWTPHVANFPSDVPIVLESRMNHQSSEQVHQRVQQTQALFDGVTVHEPETHRAII
ncbi:sugar phosphate isomerase/epimerase family protein [Leptolyngbya sp. AN03gr2]|uniref:sugar phosphate isomerase/epimerase family protein n=1 Tax=unclassified Leptolyngbya TaxID=2650499 RepID=UPI003D31375C